ncbi:putative adenosine monophosphate-protein transferase Fic [Halomonas sp. NCCP-2165]|nr:putative adenosine monophosphate-protein transferase Fic [Halomonas sp. NCCP-2165]GKW48568.1 cell division protein Fic [Halomonas sp. NCCP-2165]
MDKYGTDQDPYCYPGTQVLRNRLGIEDAAQLVEAEKHLSLGAAQAIEFEPPPYDLPYLCRLHRQLFGDLYEWAGELRTIDIAKQDTRFCTASRIAPEANKLFASLEQADYFTRLPRPALVEAVAEFYGDLNVVHPFREGNGRAQRLLFEHLIINCGYEISWAGLDRTAWVEANILAYYADYEALGGIFERCIGDPIV